MKRYGELDALRGFAALFVMLFHYSTMAGVELLGLKIGVTGVDLFFLISGFVILLTLEKTRSAKEFVISRLSRLYPSYIVMMGVTIFITFLCYREGTPGWKAIAGNLSMMQPLFRVGYIDDSYWTLTVEMQFYGLMLILFLLRQLDRIEAIGFAIQLFIMAFYILGASFFPDSAGYIAPRSLLPLINHFQLFFAGIVFYRILVYGLNRYRSFLLLFSFACSLFLFDKTGRSHFFIGLAPYSIMLCLYFFVFYLFVNGRLTWLDSPFLKWLGALSYCIYLLHQQTGRMLYHQWVDKNGIPAIAALAFLLIFIITISAFVTFCIEKPLIRLIRNRFIQKRKQPLRTELNTI